jgi:hypothetical protein
MGKPSHPAGKNDKTQCTRCRLILVKSRTPRHCKHCDWLRCMICESWFDPNKKPQPSNKTFDVLITETTENTDD